MSFMSSLAANPSGSAGVYGQSSQSNPNDTLNLVNQIKNREMSDYKDKANFMADLSLKQDRLRRLYDPQQPQQMQPQQQQDQQGMLNRMDPSSAGNNPNALQKAELGIKQQQANTESQRVNQQGQMGQQALDIRDKQEQLNTKKEGDIKDSAAAKLQAKIDESVGKLTQAQESLQAKIQQGLDTTKDHEAAMKAAKEFHDASMASKQRELDDKESQFQELTRQHKELASQRGNKTTTTSVNPEGTQRTVNTRSGSAAQNVIKTNPDSTLHVSGGPKTKDNPSGEYDIPPDKLDHWNQTYGGSDQTDQQAPPGGGDE
jgi:hypothetical protein